MTDHRPTFVRVLAGFRLLYGSALLAAPDALLGDLPEARIDRRALAFARVLGARQVVQAVMAYRWPSRRASLVGVAVDGAHAASMVTLARLDPRRRGLASANALGASAFALAGLLAARRG